MPDLERTFVMIKPDAFRGGSPARSSAASSGAASPCGALKLLRVSPEQANQHYAEHEGKPFFGELVEFITSGPVIAMVVEGPAAVSTVRTMMGATNPLDSAPGTMRGDFALEIGQNIIHGSDSPEARPARDRDLLPRG